MGRNEQTMKKIIALLLLISQVSYGAATRTVVADQIQSSDLTKLWAMPPASGTLVTSASLPSGWLLSGNAGTGGTGKIGTLDAQPFDIYTNNVSRLNVGASGDFSTIQNNTPTDGVGFRQWSQQANVIATGNTATASYLHDYRLVSFDTGGFDLDQSMGVSQQAVQVTGAGTTGNTYIQDLSSNLNGSGTITGHTGLNVSNTVGATQTVTNYYGINNYLNSPGDITNYTGFSNAVNFDNSTVVNLTGGQSQVFLDGTSAVTNTVNPFSSSLQVNDSTALTNGANGLTVGVDVNDTATSSGLTGINTYMNIRDTSSVGGVQGFSLGINQEDGTVSTGTNGFNANLQYSGTSVAASVNAVNLYARTYDTADLSSLSMIQANPEIEGSSTVDNVTMAGFYGQIRGSAVTQNVTGLDVNPTISATATADNFTAANINAQHTAAAPVTNGIKGLNLQVSSTVGQPSAVGVSIDMSNATLSAAAIAAGTQRKGLTINDGGIEAGLNYHIPSASSFFQNHYIGGGAIVDSGTPVSAFGFGTNLAQSVDFQDDWTIDGSGLGFVDVGFVGSLQGAAGKTMARWTGALGGAGNPAGDGTITDAIMFRAAGILPQGGNLAVTNMYGFQVDPNLFGLVGTNKWGFYEDSDNENALSKLAIGTSTAKVANSDTALEIGNSKAFLNGRGNTAAKNALTALAGMQFYDTTVNQLQVYDGGAWVSAGGYTPPTEIQEVPTGTIDGVNDTFTLSQTPTGNASVKIYLDGLFQRQGTDYTLSGVTVTFAAAPSTGQTIDANYDY